MRGNYENSVRDTVKDIRRLRDVDRVVSQFMEYDFINHAGLSGMNMGQALPRSISLHLTNCMTGS